MIIHFVTGTGEAQQLQKAIDLEPAMAGTVVALHDTLNIGPLVQQHGQSFSDMRTDFRRQFIHHDKAPVAVDDTERILHACNELAKSKIPIIWIWVAPNAADICSYYMVLQYAAKYAGRVCVLNIEGLPFLDEDGKIFYPKKLDTVLPRELVKARKLARTITALESELDMEEWGKIMAENASIRVQEVGKKLLSKPIDFYDTLLLGCCTAQSQKAGRIAGQVHHKFNPPVEEAYLVWRLQKLGEAGTLLFQYDVTKSMRDAEVKLVGA